MKEIEVDKSRIDLISLKYDISQIVLVLFKNR